MKRGTPEHPKLHQLAEHLGITWLHAVGLLEVLWHITAKYSPMGNIGKWDDRSIAEHFRDKRWIKKPEVLINALVECGWLDRDPDYRLLVHDWDQHADQSVRKTLKYNGQDFIKPSTEQIVYFVRAKRSNKIKIGVTGRHDGSRFRELQKTSLEPLELLLEIPGGFALEDELHRQFSATRDRVHSEWFEESESLINVIRDLGGVFPETFQHNGNTCPPHRARVAFPEPLPEPKPEPITAQAPIHPLPSWDGFDFSPWFEMLYSLGPKKAYKNQTRQVLASDSRMEDPAFRSTFEARWREWSCYMAVEFHPRRTLLEWFNDEGWKDEIPKTVSKMEYQLDHMEA